MTEVAPSRTGLAEATTRRAKRQLRVGDDQEVSRFGSAQGQVVAIGHDGEGDPLVILADSRGRRRVITPRFACHRDLTPRTMHHLDSARDMPCRATDVAR